jgi:hypothetical protein
MKFIPYSLLLFFALSCKQNKSYRKPIEARPKTITAVAEILDQKDIFIGKEFFAGDELNSVETIRTKKTGIDSISFSIYKERKNNIYIFSLERFLKNDDVEKYRIIDTINLKSADVKVNIENVGSNEILHLKSNKSLIKKWTFHKHKFLERSPQFTGSYTGHFLRMKGESGDARGGATIRLKINKTLANFQLDSYVENVNKDLITVKTQPSEIILADKEDQRLTFILTKHHNKYILKSNFIDQLVGTRETYELRRDL